MPASTLSRPLLFSFALAIAASAMAQSSDKESSTAPKQGTAKPAAQKPTAATKRLDFVPSNSVKPTTTRQQAPATPAPAQAPAKHDWNCDSETSDA